MTGPRLTWPGRGRPVVLDDRGRWTWGAPGGRAASPGPRLRTIARHGGRGPDPRGAAAREPSILVHGEAHDALRALAATHAGRVRLCYIDPPFNTGHALAYEDRAEHGVWLSCLEERIAAARALLRPGGFLCAHVNVVEQAYLKVLLDELLGRERLVAQIAWQRAPDRTVLGQGGALVLDQVEYLLVYAHGAPERDWPRPQRRAPFPAKTLRTYGRTLVPSEAARLVDEFPDRGGHPVRIYAHRSFALEPAPVGALEPPPAGAGAPAGRALATAFSQLVRLTNQQRESTFQQALLGRMPRAGVLYRAEFTQARGKHRGARTRYYLNGNVVLWLRDVARLEDGRLVRVADLNNFWTADELPVTGIAGEGGVTLRRGKKPERLLARIVEAFSRPGDWILDFFAGSGTTGAVAERLGRRWILVEAGAAALELCRPRLRRAIAGTGGAFVLQRPTVLVR